MNYFFTSSKEFNWSRGKWIISLGQKVLFICSIKCFTNVEWELRGSVSVRVGWAIEANIQNVKDSREEQYISLSLFLKDIIYLFMRDTEREAETQAEEEPGSLQGTSCRTGSQDPGVTPRAEGRCSTTEPPRRPTNCVIFIK